MKRMMGVVQQMESPTVRWTGVGLAAVGVLLVSLIQRL
jgi:uncharacterized protein YjeT (DUF2065 family)